jgi:hypothetical protein
MPLSVLLAPQEDTILIVYQKLLLRRLSLALILFPSYLLPQMGGCICGFNGTGQDTTRQDRTRQSRVGQSRAE